jgi:ethanolamine utilization protein EutQ (cupin superfamily)
MRDLVVRLKRGETVSVTFLPHSEGAFEAFDNPGVQLADAISDPDSAHMTAGWAQYGPGAHNDWTVDYDEVMVVVTGSFYIESGGERQTGGPGDLFFLRKGTALRYGSETGALAVYVSYPHWREAARAAGRL